MPISASTLELLVAAGLSGDALIAVARSIDADIASATPAPKEQSASARRQAAYRARKATNETKRITSDVTRDATCNVIGDVTGGSSLPPKNNNQTPISPPSSSLRSDDSAGAPQQLPLGDAEASTPPKPPTPPKRPADPIRKILEAVLSARDRNRRHRTSAQEAGTTDRNRGSRFGQRLRRHRQARRCSSDDDRTRLAGVQDRVVEQRSRCGPATRRSAPTSDGRRAMIEKLERMAGDGAESGEDERYGRAGDGAKAVLAIGR